MEDESDYVVVEELPSVENVIFQENIYYDQVLAPAGADTNHTTTSPVTRESGKDSKNKLIIAIVVIVLVLSAICVCTIYTLIGLSILKSEISSINMMLSSQTMNASIHLPIATSCVAILQLNPSSPSGYYSIMSSHGAPVRAY